MRKFIILILLFVGSFSAWAQNSVFGIEFGTSKDEAKYILQKRFGKINVIDFGEKLELHNVKFAGITFDDIMFEFAYINDCHVLNSASLFKRFDLTDKHNAQVSIDQVVSQMKKKYTVKENGVNELGFCKYFFGTPQRLTGLIGVEKVEGIIDIPGLYLTVVYAKYYEDAGLDDL